MLSALLVGVTGWLVGHVRTDQQLSLMVDGDEEADRVGQAALELVAMALGEVADWRPAGAVLVPLGCAAPARPAVSVDVAVEQTRVQAAVNTDSRWGADTPIYAIAWTCHAEGVLGRWPGSTPAPAVLVLIGDDPEGDGRPDISQNERLLLRAVTRTAGGSRGELAATITRAAPGDPVVVAAVRRPASG